MTPEDSFILGFGLGFAVTRVGFNGECIYDHCGPNHLETDDQELGKLMEKLSESELFIKLLKEALAFHSDLDHYTKS